MRIIAEKLRLIYSHFSDLLLACFKPIHDTCTWNTEIIDSTAGLFKGNLSLH